MIYQEQWHNLYAEFMEYLPTFTINLSQMQVHIPYIEHLGIITPTLSAFSASHITCVDMVPERAMASQKSEMLMLQKSQGTPTTVWMVLNAVVNIVGSLSSLSLNWLLLAGFLVAINSSSLQA